MATARTTVECIVEHCNAMRCLVSKWKGTPAFSETINRHLKIHLKQLRNSKDTMTSWWYTEWEKLCLLGVFGSNSFRRVHPCWHFKCALGTHFPLLVSLLATPPNAWTTPTWRILTESSKFSDFYPVSILRSGAEYFSHNSHISSDLLSRPDRQHWIPTNCA